MSGAFNVQWLQVKEQQCIVSLQTVAGLVAGANILLSCMHFNLIWH